MRRSQHIKRNALGDQKPATVSSVLALSYLFGLLILMHSEVGLADIRNATDMVSASSLPDVYFKNDSQCIPLNTTYNDFNSIPCVASEDFLGRMLSNNHPATSILEKMIPSPFSRAPVPNSTRIFEPDVVKKTRHYAHPHIRTPSALYGMYNFITHGNIKPLVKAGYNRLYRNYRAAVFSASAIISHKNTKAVAICVATCLGVSFGYNYLENMFPFAENVVPDRVDMLGFVQNNVAIVPWDQLPWVSFTGIHEFHFQVNNAFQDTLPQENINIIFELVLLHGGGIDDPDDF